VSAAREKATCPATYDSAARYPAVTRWTLVARARGESAEARAALGELCEAYYHAVEDFIRLQTAGSPEARDLTQEFFVRILAGPGFSGADQSRGRFRSYLFGAIKHFLSKEKVRRGSWKRGGRVEHTSLDAPEPETHTKLEVPDDSVDIPGLHFDRVWAETVIAWSLARLEAALAAEGRSHLFNVLKPCLQGEEAPGKSCLGRRAEPERICS
jgi:RNA polymerase sigma-70 factor (ECF subfamily)